MPAILTPGGKVLFTAAGKVLSVGPVSQPSGTLSLTLDDFKVSPSTGGRKPHFVIQRKAGQQSADVPIYFGYTGADPAGLEARTVHSRTGAVVRNWTTCTAFAAAGGAGFCLLPNHGVGAFEVLQIRVAGSGATSGALFSAGAVEFGVGAIFGFFGQSNAVFTLFGGLAAPVPGYSQGEEQWWDAGNVPGGVFDSEGWRAPHTALNVHTAALGGYMFMRMLARGLKSVHGKDVAVGLVPFANNGSAISNFLPQTSPNSDNNFFTRIFLLSGTTQGAGIYAEGLIGMASPRNYYAGDFEGFGWYQGEGNAGMPTATYVARLAELYQGALSVVAPFGRDGTTLGFWPCVLPQYASGTPGTETVRQALLQFEAYARTQGWTAPVTGWTTIDLPNDTFHIQGEAAQITSFRRLIQSMLKWVGAATFSGRGPALAGTATRSGLVATLPVVHDGGATLVPGTAGQGLTGFTANTNAAFTGSAIVVTAAVSGNAAIQVTFPSGTTFPAYVRYMDRPLPDTSNCVFDDVQYPTGGTSGVDIEVRGLPLLPGLGTVAIP